MCAAFTSAKKQPYDKGKSSAEHMAIAQAFCLPTHLGRT
jgi:hypothetical protein